MKKIAIVLLLLTFFSSTTMAITTVTSETLGTGIMQIGTGYSSANSGSSVYFGIQYGLLSELDLSLYLDKASLNGVSDIPIGTNISGKLQIIKETKDVPAVSLAATYSMPRQILVGKNLSGYGIGISASKKINEKLVVAIGYAQTQATLDSSGSSTSASDSGINVGLDYSLMPDWIFSVAFNLKSNTNTIGVAKTF